MQAELVTALREAHLKLAREAQDSQAKLELAEHENRLLQNRSMLSVRHRTGKSTERRSLSWRAQPGSTDADGSGDESEIVVGASIKGEVVAAAKGAETAAAVGETKENASSQRRLSIRRHHLRAVAWRPVEFIRER